MKKTYSVLIFFLFLISYNCFSQQCLTSGFCSGGYQYPSGTFSSNTNSWTTITTNNWAGEYAVYNVTSGSTYQWSLCSADGGSVSYDAQLTLINNTSLSNICYSDDQCLNSIGTSNAPKIQWTATFTGTVRVLINQFPCATNSTNTTLVWRCSSCGSGSAPANDNCSGATALTVYSGSSCGGATTGNVTGATQSLAAITCGSFTGTSDDDIWYKFVATSSANHVITVTPSVNFDAVVDVRSGSCNGTNIACADDGGTGGIESISLTGLTNGTTYYVRVYDYFTGVPSTPTFTICVTAPSSCVPSYTSGTSSGDYINRIRIGTIDNTPAGTGSTSGASYNDYYATVSTTLQAGTNQTVITTVGTYGAQTVAAWIDYNQDGDFADAGENLGEVSNVGAGANATINFTIPTSATSGNTRMRVRTVWSDIGIDPCLTYGWGEAEDYKINITPACTTPGTPVSLNTSGIGSSGATLNWLAGSPAGSATVTYYWAINTSSTVDYETNYIQRGTTTSLNSGALSGLLNGSTYYWTVKAYTSCDATASSYASTINFTTTCITPSAPTALITTGTTTTSSTFNWTASASGSPTISYYWAVGPLSNVTYESGYTDRGITTALNATTFILSAGTTYYWTVKAITSCNSNASAYPVAISFTTNNVPTPIVTWLGGTSDDWLIGANWSSNPSLPAVTDNVIIPSGCTFYPNITTGGLSIGNSTTARKCKTLTINSGGTVTVNSAYYVYISDVVDIAGTFNHQSSNATPDFGFQINSGGKVTVKNGGILNVGSSAISAGLPAGTIKEMNDIKITDGKLEVQSGAKVFIMDDLQITGTSGVKGKLIMTGGDLYIKYYGNGGNGASATYGFDTYMYSDLNISGGNIYLCGQDADIAGSQMVDWNSSSTVSITGGNIYLMNEQSSGSINSAGKCNFGGFSINNLIVNRTGITSTIITNNLSINGDLTLTAGTLSGGSRTLTIAGNITNNAGSTTAFDNTTASTVICTGSGKQIGGTSSIKFYNLTFNSGSSYTLNNPTYTMISNNFTQNSNSTINIASGIYLDIYGATNIFNGTISAVSNYDATRDIDLNSTGNFSGTGTINADLRIWGGTSTLTSNFGLNGNFTIRSGAGFTMTTHQFTCNGDWTNDGTFTCGSSTVFLTGTSKNITGSAPNGAASAFNNLTIQSGASYTFNPLNVDNNIDVTGTFQNDGNLTIASGKFIDLYAQTALGTSIILNGTITSLSPHNGTFANGTQDIDINNTVGLSGNGNITADVRIYGGTTTLNSDMTINGDFWTSSLGPGTFAMSTHTLSVGGSWANYNVFNSGTGTVKFIGSTYSTVNANCNFSGSAKATADFYNVVIDRTSDTLAMYNTPMRVVNNFTITNGIFSTGWKTNSNGNGGQNRRLTIAKIATISSAGKLYIGYWKACGAANEGLPCGTSDSLNIPVFHGDLINYGAILTNRPLSSGYSDLKLTGARITGAGNTNEFGVDIQPEDGLTVTQVGSVDIQGDLIIQDPAANLWENSNPDNVLTIRGNFYLYGSFTHNGIINIYGNMTNGGNVSNTVSINQSTFNFYQTGTKYTILDKNPIQFGYVNIKSGTGTREFRQNIDISKDLTIESGSTLDVYSTSPKNITLSGTTSSWYNNGIYIPYTGIVTFSGNGEQTMGGNNASTFYNLTINKSNSSNLNFNNNGTITNQLTLTAGYIVTTASRLLTVNDQASVSPAGGNSGSYVKGPVKKVGRDGVAGPYSFLFPTGKNSTYARLYLLHYSGAAATTDAFTAEYYDFIYPNSAVSGTLNNVSTNEYWELTKNSGDAALKKRVRLYSENNVISGIQTFNNSDMTIAHFNSGTSKWEDIGNTSNSGAGTPSGWITSEFTSNFSPFTFGSKTAINPLPVTLLSFNAISENSQVNILWTTTSEFNNDYFTIEKSRDLVNTEIVGKVPGAGNSNSSINYFFIDKYPFQGISYYRLKQTDFDGKYKYTDWVAVEFKKYVSETNENFKSENSFNIINVFPNPAKDKIYVTVETDSDQSMQFSLFDIMGKKHFHIIENFSKGVSQINLNISNVTPGTYILYITGSNGIVQKKIIKQ